MIFMASSALAEREYEPPLVRCLNDNVLPEIPSNRSAVTIVDEAFKKCSKNVNIWMKERESLSPNIQTSQYGELHDFYIRMIEIRRKVIAKRNHETAQ
ncbi:Uncharacterized protein EbC_32260 [Erwinia billingiae Eb661]|uniref:Phage protein n=1 Tax=Erwinia billingiae (strain Eb661) TaxID=634500 RepID=D8MVA0_ERWBE|nr:Uncharacterized protein EbC_32260 [Erwinia billingiae Eb661]